MFFPEVITLLLNDPYDIHFHIFIFQPGLSGEASHD